MAVVLPPLSAETIFHIGSFAVTNSYISGTLTVLVIIGLGLIIKNVAQKTSWQQAPVGFMSFLEFIFESIFTFMDQVTGNPSVTKRAAPLVISLFFFILFSNWSGLLPGVGSIGVYQLHEGHIALIPFFRPATTDLNMTLAMGLTAVTVSHVGGIFLIGSWKYFNKYIKLIDVFQAIRSLSPLKLLIALVECAIGVIEMFSEIAKVASLSLRLFGNIFAGEVLLTVLAGLIPVLAPLPFIALELLVGVIQALVFSLLALVYITMAAVESHAGHDAHATSAATPAVH